MKLISWNVNGIRAVLKKGLSEYIFREDPDIFCVQETKAHPDQVGECLAHFPHNYWNSAEKKGYSGTAIFSKIQPKQVTYGIGIGVHDREGRVITLEFEKFYLVNVYTPNAQRELTRLSYRVQWDRDFLDYLKHLQTKKPVIFCGDLNVAPTPIDLARPKENVGNAGFTDEERMGFSNITKAGFIDSFRALHPETISYTWWSYQSEARKRNIGWRIDFFCLDPKLRVNLKDAFIHPEVEGSDHCPVGIVLSLN